MTPLLGGCIFARPAPRLQPSTGPAGNLSPVSHRLRHRLTALLVTRLPCSIGSVGASRS